MESPGSASEKKRCKNKQTSKTQSKQNALFKEKNSMCKGCILAY